MSTPLVLVGLSHRRAPVEIRERLALSADEAAALAATLVDQGGEAVCLSTCNRTEIYLALDDVGHGEGLALSAMANASGMEADVLGVIVYRLHDDDVPLHLFRVAAGLDSLVPGEGEILGQVRDAFERGRPGVLLDRMFRSAIHAGRRVRTETAIGEVPASVAAAAAALAEQLFGKLDTCRVLLVGAGKTGELAARSLAAHGARIDFVANRSRAKAAEVCARYGGAPISLDEIPARLAEIDAVVCSTGARGHVITRSQVEPGLRARGGRPLFFIDIAVPRDVEPSVHELDGCFVYDIDDLETVVVESAPERADHLSRAEAIAGDEADGFRAWRASRDVVPAIASLRARAEEIRAGELDRMHGRLAQLSESDRSAVEALTARIVHKLLHAPTVRLKEVAAGADGAVAAELVRELFDLAEDAAPDRNSRQ
jgi:glutamyl-tRNA reductase